MFYLHLNSEAFYYTALTNINKEKEKGGGRRGGLWKTKDFFFFHFYPNSDKGKNVFIILIYSIIVY